jgi:uncharacterized protein (TIGR00730 family)
MAMLGGYPSRSEISAQQSQPLSVAVFCTAGPGTPTTVKIAQELGEMIGQNAHRLVYGGSSVGLMGKLAEAAHTHGSQIFGAIPLFLFERDHGTVAPSQVLRITRTICQRKDAMLAMADVFIALPGGLDTIDEVLDVVALSCLGLNTKPLLLLETRGEWQPLLDLLGRLTEDDRAKPLDDRLLRVVASAAEALTIVNELRGSL